MTMNNNKPQTPTEKLTAEKNKVSQLLKEQERTINAHVVYIQDNAGSLLLSFVSSMLFSPSSKKDAQAGTSDADAKTPGIPSEPLSLADFLPVAKLMLPVAWDLARPILISWGIKKAGALFSGLFTRKKAQTNN